MYSSLVTIHCCVICRLDNVSLPPIASYTPRVCSDCYSCHSKASLVIIVKCIHSVVAAARSRVLLRLRSARVTVSGISSDLLVVLLVMTQRVTVEGRK